MLRFCSSSQFTLRTIGAGIVAASCFAPPLHAQSCQPAWDAAFGVPGADGIVRAFVLRTVGQTQTLYAGGVFDTIGGVTAHRIASWNGQTWSPLAAGMNNNVHALAIYDDASGGGPALFAGGLFTQAGDQSVGHIAKWIGGAWAPLGQGLSGNVFAMAVYDDGAGPALFVAGDFTSAGGAPANRVAKWKNQAWSPLGAGVGPTGSAGLALQVFDDGGGQALFIGGKFASAGPGAASNVARWRAGAWTGLASGLNDQVDCLAVHNDGGGNALFAGGRFTASGVTGLPHIARWRGGAWTGLGPGATDAGASVRALTVFDDGGGPALIAGGEFANFGPVAASRVARWKSGAWTSLGSGPESTVNALGPHSLAGVPRLAVGGGFATAGGAPASYVAAWTGCVAQARPADINADGVVNASDLALLLGSWGAAGSSADVNHDGFVNSSDLAILLGSWGV